MAAFFLRLVRWRGVLFELTLAHWKTRYKKAHFGFLWAFGNPLAMALVLSFVFGKFLKYPAPDFPVFLLVALIPWWFFVLSASHAVVSVWDNASLVQRCDFPRELLPISVVLANLINFALGMVLLLPFLALYDVSLTWYAALTPLVVVLELLLLTGIGLIVSVAYVFFHDARYVVEAGTLLLFYLSPVFYPDTFVSAPLLPLYALNPMAGILSAYRHLLLEASLPNMNLVAVSTAMTVAIFAFGVWVFERYAPTLADYL